MRIEDQVCGLELARKLKELGVKQESLFYWKERRGIGSEYTSNFGDPELRISPHHVSSLIAMEPDRKPDGQFTRTFSAFTVAELGEIMTKAGHGSVSHFGDTACATLVKKQWWVTGGEWIVPKQKYSHLETDEKWADALAKMLIHLIENGIITQESKNN